MKKVITYGTFDVIHYGHIRLLERAKSLGDYLIVGVTSDDYDKSRGKINVFQNVIERVENVKKLGIADEIVIEEYEGQKIDDIIKYCVDIFAIGSDWIGKFDYLKDYCDVVYLERTKGISSSELRASQYNLKVGLVGQSIKLSKFYEESKYVNGIDIIGICCQQDWLSSTDAGNLTTLELITDDYEKLLAAVDAVYIVSHPSQHYLDIKRALLNNKHVLCESPIDIDEDRVKDLFTLAEKNNLVLVEMIKTAYSMAYSRMLLIAKSGRIGDIVSVETTCTRLQNILSTELKNNAYVMSSINAWGPTAVLPVFHLLGTDYLSESIVAKTSSQVDKFDLFAQVNFLYPHAVATIKVGRGVKSEGDLVITGTKGYIYVPAPWWKTEYFEIRYENTNDNRRYFYQLEGEGIRYAIVAFLKNIESKTESKFISKEISIAIASLLSDFNHDINTVWI